MNIKSAYLLGMIFGNGEIQRESQQTTITIDIPYKNLKTDDNNDVQLYVKSSLFDMRPIMEEVIGNPINTTSGEHSTKLSFTRDNNQLFMQIVSDYIESGTKQQNIKMSSKVFSLSRDHQRSLLRGIADVTAYIRKSNIAYGQANQHRVYIEVPQNWQMVADIANLLKSVDVPIQTIDFGHPNFRDANMTKYNEGKHSFWKKEHQIKIWANEFIPIGFNVTHKQKALEEYSNQLLQDSTLNATKTHLYYWQKSIRRKTKPIHPCENDCSLPDIIRGKHYASWTELAEDLGYHG
ncbi:hypothetical protein IMAU70089_02862 [Lactiplantibacillus plantarum]|uniref:hypothetical protein n=1 Tax=Lactiplantibacillus plantarum TaxID=1590 RepID=UPI001C73BC70|nr:hypothetical protein [Lactiplantibacillus plantarum]MBX0343140.1 hypothetical protein [Lactiplantibacillus plantarum]MCG0697647.1 hypothetical protein [Lactiplantibacillus plantarum]MCG0700598.1 hypothetical protein [Lactiplantibacillus plantarum]MCG0703559.1 hypothetical protein [Lactiplantibacillus plantarum]MCG0706583.1 hypothetical protein [Lactiplantibacillus plantarum]